MKRNHKTYTLTLTVKQAQTLVELLADVTNRMDHHDSKTASHPAFEMYVKMLNMNVPYKDNKNG